MPVEHPGSAAKRASTTACEAGAPTRFVSCNPLFGSSMLLAIPQTSKQSDCQEDYAGIGHPGYPQGPGRWPQEPNPEPPMADVFEQEGTLDEPYRQMALRNRRACQPQKCTHYKYGERLCCRPTAGVLWHHDSLISEIPPAITASRDAWAYQPTLGASTRCHGRSVIQPYCLPNTRITCKGRSRPFPTRTLSGSSDC